MKTLLVVFIIFMGPDGQPEEHMLIKKPYDSLAECNVMGENFRDLLPDLPDSALTFSTCIEPSDFEEESG